MNCRLIRTLVLMAVLSLFFLTDGYCQASDKVYEIQTKKLGPNLFRMSYKINNWLVLTGSDGVLLSDAAPEFLAPSIKMKLKEMGNDNVRFIINTHWHHDHTGGNILFGRRAVIMACQSVRDFLSKEQKIFLFNESFKAYPEYALPKII